MIEDNGVVAPTSALKINIPALPMFADKLKAPSSESLNEMLSLVVKVISEMSVIKPP